MVEEYIESKTLRELMDKKIMCAERGGGVRFSPHFYTDAERIEKALFIANQL